MGGEGVLRGAPSPPTLLVGGEGWGEEVSTIHLLLFFIILRYTPPSTFTDMAITYVYKPL